MFLVRLKELGREEVIVNAKITTDEVVTDAPPRSRVLKRRVSGVAGVLGLVALVGPNVAPDFLGFVGYSSPIALIIVLFVVRYLPMVANGDLDR